MMTEGKERKVIKIEATPRELALDENAPKKRVAAYARVSTASDEQLASYEAQVTYYPSYVASRPGWVFVGLYADAGISGTSNKRREDFKRMIADALDGRIDLIVTKSISRFGRNTVDTLTSLRELKAVGVEVYFEKENLYTLDSKSEFVLTLMSCIAQEESRSLSENVTWGIRKRFAEGRYGVPYAHFFGFERGADGKPAVVDGQAAIVRTIFRLYLEGRTPSHIAAMLTEEGVPSPAGCPRWRYRTVLGILSNEKYHGAARLQKCFTMDYLTKKQKANDGELPQYYIESDHEAIVSKTVFDEAQLRLSSDGYDNPSLYAFSNKIICGHCGAKYGRKLNASYKDDKRYLKAVWRCNNRYSAAGRCPCTIVHDKEAGRLFARAVQMLWKDDGRLAKLCRRLVVSAMRSGGAGRLGRGRAKAVGEFIAGFRERASEGLPIDDSAIRVMLVKAVVTEEAVFEMTFIDGSVIALPITNSDRRRGSR
jgi:DNA invertase Pin-like site-specific DNA recombinase